MYHWRQSGASCPPLSRCASGITRYEGTTYFAALLTALGKDNFYRGYEWSYQWAPLLEQVMLWTGLKCGVWFFHAHVSEQFTAEKETEVALFSPITPQQFNDGAFDKSWFLTAYKMLGEERFQTLYKSAKYITTGSIQHRRSQLYADAVLGKLSETELKQVVVEKRNQEKLRCYPLIPLKDEADALARYEFIRRFEHESRQFGAQWRDSEKKACRTALENLAITMDCPDVDRMLWRLEGKKLESVRTLMEPQDLGGVTVSLAVGPDGAPSLAIEKDGKTLTVKENALHLVHPHELAEAKIWGAWQRRLFEDKLIQPFKQVFREYYALTDEERAEKNLSRRYAGNQVQPKRAVALLRGRGFTVDYEEGLKKVCYDEDLVVRIYAMADWFSPAEIEPPTLEVVRFSRRSDGKPLDLEAVPPITFSEAMRDLDLMVSVAHTGGVDPEASHSTVEMRVAIAMELLRLLHVENVDFIGSH